MVHLSEHPHRPLRWWQDGHRPAQGGQPGSRLGDPLRVGASRYPPGPDRLALRFWEHIGRLRPAVPAGAQDDEAAPMSDPE